MLRSLLMPPVVPCVCSFVFCLNHFSCLGFGAEAAAVTVEESEGARLFARMRMLYDFDSLSSLLSSFCCSLSFLEAGLVLLVAERN